jgi:hypothetical protein
MKFQPPCLSRISLNKLEGVEKLAAFICLERFSTWAAADPTSRFDYANRVRRDLFFLLGAEESVNSLLLGPVGTVFEECVTVSIRDENKAQIDTLPDDAAIDLRGTLWSVFVRLGFRAQKDFAKTLGIDPAVVTRVFKTLTASPAESCPTANTKAGITIDRLNQALVTAGVVPRFDRLSRRYRHGDRQQPDAAQLDGALTVRELHLVKLAGYVGRLAERSSPHSAYQFIEHFTCLVQCAAESWCWLTASSEPRKTLGTTAVLDTAFTLVCHSLGSIPDMPRNQAAPQTKLLEAAAVFGAGPVFCPTISRDVDVAQRLWQKVLAADVHRLPADQECNSQLYSEFATDWCVRRIASSITGRASEFLSHGNAPFTHSVLDEDVLQALNALEKPSPRLFQQLQLFWKHNLEKQVNRSDDPHLRESLFWRFIWEITPAIQVCSYGGEFQHWRDRVGPAYLERLKRLNEAMEEVAISLAAAPGDELQQSRLVAEFNEYDCKFHLALAECFRATDFDGHTTPLRPSQDASLLRRLFAITTQLRSKRRHSDCVGRSHIIKEHREIIEELFQISVSAAANSCRVNKNVNYLAPELLQKYVNALYRHLFSSPDNETANSTHPFIPSLARLIYSLPCIDKHADLQRQWQQCQLMVLLAQGTEPLEFVFARNVKQQEGPLATNLRDLFSTIALSLLDGGLHPQHNLEGNGAQHCNSRLVVLAGNQQSYFKAKALLRQNAALLFETWDDFKRQLNTGLQDLKDALLRVCLDAMNSRVGDPGPTTPWSQLVKKATCFGGVTPADLQQKLDALIVVEDVCIPEFAVGAGELLAVSWQEDQTVSFTCRKRNSDFIHYGADNSDDRNGLVLQAVLRSLSGISKRRVLRHIEMRCREWLGINLNRPSQAESGAGNTTTHAATAKPTPVHRVPETQEETAIEQLSRTKEVLNNCKKAS